MHRYPAIKVAALATVAAITTSAWGSSIYTAQQIGLTGAAYQTTDSALTNTNSSTVLESNNIYFADTAGDVIGGTVLQPSGNTAFWYFNSVTNLPTVRIGLYANTATTNYLSPTSGQANPSLLVSYGSSRDINNGYIAGTNSTYSNVSGSASTGKDAWIFNSTTGITKALPIATVVPSNSYGANLAYNYNIPTGTNAGFNAQLTGSAVNAMPGGNGSAVVTAPVYYNSGTASSPSWAAIGNGFSDNDAWYYNGTSTYAIGLINSNNVNTVGATAAQPFDRSSTPIQINSTGQVFGFSKNYAGSTTLTGSNGQDLWIYDPNNALGTGVNGTYVLSPTAPAGDGYTGGNSTITTPVYMNNAGQAAAAYQLFATSDTGRTTALAQDTFIASAQAVGAPTYTQVGLTASNDPIYTFYQGTGSGTAAGSAAVGFGGSNFATPSGYIATYPAINANGQAVGYSKRSTSTAALGQDAWVYYPAGNVPANAVAGSTRIGLIGGAYETNTGAGVNRSSGAVALSSTSGAVAGYSQRFITSASVTNAGQDAWVYDPANGVTTSTLVGLTGANYEFTQPGATNNFRYSIITAISNDGMVGGTTRLFPTSTSSINIKGLAPWVYVASTNTTYSIDPAAAAITSSSSGYFYSNIAYISDTGVVLGYDGTIASAGTPTNAGDKLFEWSLANGFEYLGASLDPTSTTNWSQIYNTYSGVPSITATGTIVGLGGLSSESSNSVDAVELTPTTGVPEPTSLSVIGLAAAALLGRRRKAR